MLSKLRNRKGQVGLGSLAPATLALMTLGIIVSIAFIILSNFITSQTSAQGGNTTGCTNAGANGSSTDPVRALCNVTDAFNDNLVSKEYKVPNVCLIRSV